MVTYCWAVALPGPTFTLPNESELGLTVARGCTPVPERATVWGEPGASSGIESVPLAAPVAVGAKSTWMVQLAPGAITVFEQPSVAIAKGAPTAADAMFKVPVPEFVTITDWLADLVPTTWFPKARLEADRDTAGWTPLPLTATVCGAFDASSLKVRVPLNVPRLAGAKPICTEHVAPAESVAPAHELAITL